MEDNNMSASGEGNGVVEFNIKENQIVKDVSHFTINIHIKSDKNIVTGFVKSDSEKITTIK